METYCDVHTGHVRDVRSHDMRNLVIAPHADDEVLGTGGTIQKRFDNQEKIYVVVCGRRTQDDKEQFLDATKHYNTSYLLPYEDEHYYESFDSMLKEVESIYNEIKPNNVYIPNKSDFNRDHRCVHEICEIVCRRFQSHEPDRVFMYETPSSTTQSFDNNFKCNWYEQLTSTQLKHKIETFMKYKNETRDYPNPRSPIGITSYARFRGMECNSNYAEGFNLLYSKN